MEPSSLPDCAVWDFDAVPWVLHVGMMVALFDLKDFNEYG